MSKIKGTREKHFPYGKVYQKRDFGNERVATLDELLMKDPVPPGDAMLPVVSTYLNTILRSGTLSQTANPKCN